MKIKICTKCDKELPSNKDYYSADNSNNIDGLRRECKECAKSLRCVYVIKNKERLSKNNKERYKNNKEYHKNYNKKYHSKNKDEILKRKKEHYYSNIISEKERNLLWRNKNKHNLSEYSRERNLQVPSASIVNYIYNKTGISKEVIKQNPELIKTQRLLTKIKRELWNQN